MHKSEARILLVEDNRADVQLTVAALRGEKLCNQIDVVRDGEEALDYLFRRGAYSARAAGEPTVVLLDLKLPKVDGLQVLRELKQDATTRTIPVVVLTSSREERDMVESYRMGVNSYIQKPVDFAQFREMVKQLGFYWLLVNQALPAGALESSAAATAGQ